MREWIYNSWNLIMDDKRNPLSSIPDNNVRHMIMQILAWVWCIAFAMMVGSWTAFGISAIGHIFLLAAITITVATFETAKRKPETFNFMNGYHSHGRARSFMVWRDKDGNAQKVELDPNDPGGEHE